MVLKGDLGERNFSEGWVEKWWESECLRKIPCDLGQRWVGRSWLFCVEVLHPVWCAGKNLTIGSL